jgi:hypothetical protein
MPHYMGMTADLDLSQATRSVKRMLALGLMAPLGGPAESILVGPGDTVRRWHSVQTSLNAFFETIGYYHAIALRSRRVDAIYKTSSADSRLRAALASEFGARGA